MPSTAARSNYSSCSLFKNVLTPKILFLTLIISIALTIRSAKTKEESNCYICSSMKVFIKTICGIMDIFIIFIKAILNKIVATKTMVDTKLQAITFKSTRTASETQTTSNVEIKEPPSPVVVNDPPQIQRKSFTIEENTDTVLSRRNSRREPATSNEEQKNSFVLAKNLELRPSRTKPIPSFVVLPRVSVTNFQNELDDKRIQELEKEVSKQSEQPKQFNENTRIWRSESRDGPRELFELTMPVPVYSDDGLLMGYDDDQGGIMKWDSKLGGYYKKENGEVILMGDRQLPVDFSPEKPEQEMLQNTILKHGLGLETGSHEDDKKRVTLTISDEDWAANCDCTDDEEKKMIPVIRDDICFNCTCDDVDGSEQVTISRSDVKSAPDCKCKDASKLTVSVKSIQTQEDIKSDLVIEPKVEPEIKSEILNEVSAGPWGSKSLDGPKQISKGEGRGFTKEEEEEYFLREGKCSHYDDNKCKRCRCYRQKFTREQLNNQANIYKGCLANTGIKRKKKDSVRLSKTFERPCEKEKPLEPLSIGSKVLSSELKSIKSLDQPIISSNDERCHCNSTTSEVNFRSTNCRCPSSNSQHKSSIFQRFINADRCHCLDPSKTSQRLKEMSYKSSDCTFSKVDLKPTSHVSPRSVSEDRCRCPDSDSKTLKGEMSSKTIANECNAKLAKNEARGKDCKCSNSNLQYTKTISERSINDDRCKCRDPSETKSVKSEIFQKSKDCKCLSTNSEPINSLLKRSLKDYPCRCLNTSKTNRIKSEMLYSKSKDCRCPTTVSKVPSPTSNLITSKSQYSSEKDPCYQITSDIECLKQGLGVQSKHSKFTSPDSRVPSYDSKRSDYNQIHSNLSPSSRSKTISKCLDDLNRKNKDSPDAKVSGAYPNHLIDDNFDVEFTKLRAAKRKLMEQQQQSTQIGPSLERFVAEQKRMQKLLNKKKNKKKY